MERWRSPFIWPSLILVPIFAVIFNHLPKTGLHRVIDISLDVAGAIMLGLLALLAYGAVINRRRKGRIDAYLAQRSAERRADRSST